MGRRPQRPPASGSRRRQVEHARPNRGHGAPHARRPARPQLDGGVPRAVATVRPRPYHHPRPATLPRLQRRVGRGDDGRDPAPLQPSRMGRRELHGVLHGQVRLREHRPRRDLRLSGACRRVRARRLPRRHRTRRPAWPSDVSNRHEQAVGHVGDRARPLHPRPLPLSDRAAAPRRA